MPSSLTQLVVRFSAAPAGQQQQQARSQASGAQASRVGQQQQRQAGPADAAAQRPTQAEGASHHGNVVSSVLGAGGGVSLHVYALFCNGSALHWWGDAAAVVAACLRGTFTPHPHQ
jgi:hypothetical protein